MRRSHWSDLMPRSSRKPLLNRRAFLYHSTSLLGGVALATLLREGRRLRQQAQAELAGSVETAVDAVPVQFAGKRVIYLFQSGGPSQMDLFDSKPELKRRAGENLPSSVLGDAHIPNQSRSQ